ncbi:MAG: 30S ribosomal protein S18 [Candidatus Pacebacteria bacterium]|nr:30S ribosomal protein S18 [Candidatus Paceibacterota bacterium]
MNNQNNLTEKKQCLFCIEKERDVDYKDPQTLRRFISQRAKIMPPKRTGACTKHQRKISNAIKRARFMGLLPYIAK